MMSRSIKFLCNEVIGGRKEGKACLVMLFFRDEAGKSGRFQTLLQEELVDGLPAFLFGAGPEEHADGIAALFSDNGCILLCGRHLPGILLKEW